MTEQKWRDIPSQYKKPTQAKGVSDALLRAARSATGNLNPENLPRNRAEARRFLKANGPHMRFRYEVDDQGVRRAVRVRV